MQSLSVLIVHLTCLLALLLPTGGVVMDDTKTFAQPCKAARKLSAIFGLDIARFAPMGNQVISIGTRLPSNCVERARAWISTHFENGSMAMRR